MSPRFQEWCLRARPWLQLRRVWIALILLVALSYYGSYVRYGINFHDEGGTVALGAKRLLEGERPLVDVALGYNVLWFYPVVGLFKLFGVNFVLLRAYCFALSTITAVLAFLVVERAGRRPWLAFMVALLAVLVPGMTFKNYMPLLAVANAYCLLHFVLGARACWESPPSAADELLASKKPQAPPWRWLALGALVLGLTFLVRIDVGFFVSALWLGSILLRALRPGETLPARLILVVSSIALLATIVVLVHAPVWWDAQRRGFSKQFIAQYPSAWDDLTKALQERISRKASPSLAALPKEPAVPLAGGALAVAAKSKAKAPAWNTEGLARKPFNEIWRAKKPKDRLLALLIYAPLFTLVPVIAWAAAAVLVALRRRDSLRLERGVGALVLTGAALTTFPQYFFFRADSPHLSEFSPGFWVGIFGGVLLLRSLGGTDRRWPRIAGSALLVMLTLHAGTYLWRMLPDRWTGTIAARKDRHKFFKAENGVNVFVTNTEFTGLTQLAGLVVQHSTPADYLVAYPYHPSINLLTNRRTYEKNVYIDNATQPPGWNEQAIKRFEKFRPAVIVLSDWDINGTEASRFSVWGEKAKTWIQTNYLNQGNVLEFEVFTRPEREQ